MHRIVSRKPKAVLSPTENRIVKTARGLFLGEGYARVTTDRLCKEAAVSKSSIYKYFGDMSGVLAAVVRLEGDAVGRDAIPEPMTAGEFWSSLLGYGVNLLTLLNQPTTINLDRMLHEQAREFPQVSRFFYNATYGRSHSDLTAMIEVAKDKRYVTKPQSAELLADYLFCAWCGLGFARTRLGLMDKPYVDPRARAFEGTQALFESDFKPSPNWLLPSTESLKYATLSKGHQHHDKRQLQGLVRRRPASAGLGFRNQREGSRRQW